MFDNSNLKHLSELSKMAVEASKQLDSHIGLMDSTLSETLKMMDDDRKGEVEKIQALTQKAINLARAGKTEQANEIIKEFKNGSQSNKTGI